jgi:hypothetical protein
MDRRPAISDRRTVASGSDACRPCRLYRSRALPVMSWICWLSAKRCGNRGGRPPIPLSCHAAAARPDPSC